MLHEARGEDLIDTWTLVDSDWRLVANKHGATRLGFALLLKFFESEARFPRDHEELPPAAVAYVADQVKVQVVGTPYRCPVLPMGPNAALAGRVAASTVAPRCRSVISDRENPHDPPTKPDICRAPAARSDF